MYVNVLLLRMLLEKLDVYRKASHQHPVLLRLYKCYYNDHWRHQMQGTQKSTLAINKCKAPPKQSIYISRFLPVKINTNKHENGKKKRKGLVPDSTLTAPAIVHICSNTPSAPLI